MKIRFIEKQDYEKVLKIYEEYIETTITFEYELPTFEEFKERIEKIKSKYPYLVAEENGKIIGYAYAHEFKERTAYQWGAELSVYLDKTATGKGVGTKLYNAIIEILKMQGINTVYALITEENDTSVKMHEKYGFKHVATIKNVGFKNKKWLAVSWYEKIIAPYLTNPQNIISVNNLEKPLIQSVLDKK